MNLRVTCKDDNFQDLGFLAHFSISLSTFLSMNVLSCLKWCSICYQVTS